MVMFIKFGNWILRYRQIIFPILHAGLFLPSSTIFPWEWSFLIGGVLIVAGVLIRSITIGLEYVIKGNFQRKIYATIHVPNGIYSLCRNPMYFGNLLLLLGFGIFANSKFFILIIFPIILLLYLVIINAEESILLEKYDDEYKKYKAEVSMLLPDLNRIQTAFKGFHFNWKWALKKEYNSWFLYFSVIDVLLFCNGQIGSAMTIISAVIIITLYVLLRFLEKMQFLN
jgi:protein-S-isoprenylcysteine O-methyltransferase Ste14